MTKVYLAGPDVFQPNAVEIGRKKIELRAHYGLAGLDPLDDAIDIGAKDASLQIFRATKP
jgi:nucleoside 2-deoxyribosyltransferase